MTNGRTKSPFAPPSGLMTAENSGMGTTVRNNRKALLSTGSLFPCSYPAAPFSSFPGHLPTEDPAISYRNGYPTVSFRGVLSDGNQLRGANHEV